MDAVFAPGTSPFRTRGNVYRALLESADRRVPGGRSAVLAQLADPALRAFFEQSFLAASSYDIFPLVPFGMAGAKVAGMPYPDWVRRGAEFTAVRDMNGVYRVILKLASPEMVVKRLPRILAQYFDFGEIVGEFHGPKRYEATARGLPRPIALWLTYIAQGFVPVVLQHAGAREVTIEVRAPLDAGTVHGVTIVTTSFEVRWA